jgi:hypothetical protein
MAQARSTQREACDLPGTLLEFYQYVPAQREQDSLRFTCKSPISSMGIEKRPSKKYSPKMDVILMVSIND